MNLTCENISFSYGNRKVLDDISFEAQGGKLLSILGSNGVGKSTLFRCMLGLLSGWDGDVKVDGRSIKNMSASEISRYIAYIPQSTSPAFNYSVEDIVLMGTTAGKSAFRTPKHEEMVQVDEALHKLGIESIRKRCFHHLSGGERQLVIIARALAQNAKILMLDEPTSSLDFANQTLVLKRERSLADEGYTVIQTTHSPEQSYKYSDRIVALKGGHVLKEGSPKEVMSEDIISSLYSIDVDIMKLKNDSVRVCLAREETN